MRVLGVDPGITNTGYGLVIEDSGHLKATEYGSILTSASDGMSERLDILYRGIRQAIENLEPDVVALEQLFFSSNQKTALAVGQALGVIMLACKHSGVSWEQYTPLQVKQAVVGNGNAKKEQVQYMVGALLAFKEPPQSLHACDALAIAICHLNSRRMREATGT